MDNEQRELEIKLNAQQANASIKDMAAGVALLGNQLNKMAQDDPRRAALKRDFDVLTERVGAARKEMRTYVQTEEEVAAATAKLNQENLQVVLNGQKVNASFKDMNASAAQLEKQLEEMNGDDPGRKKMLADYHALQDRIEGVKKEMGQAKEGASTLAQAFAFAGVTVGAEAVLDTVKELGAEVISTTKEVAELRSTINTMTGATGAELDSLTTSVLAVSRTFDKDFNEVLAASNTLSKQMGVSQQEALRLIQQGFLAGADAGGDFLDQVKEYAPQFKNAGFAANEFIGHISQASLQGIFSDKGADVVKEFGLRIREQTKATSEAMQAAFGSDFTKEIFDGINKGTLTVEQALQRVGKEMDETQIPANQLQTVIADVFGGPGEDAGIDYLKSLKNVGKGIDELVDKTNAYTRRQQALLASQTELAEAQNALTKEFEGGGTILDTLTNKSMTVLYTLLASLGTTFKELFQPVQEIWKSLTDLAQAMGWVSTGTLSAKSAGELLGSTVRLMLTNTRILFGVLSEVIKATVDWAKSSESAREVLGLVALPVKVLYDLLSNGPAYFEGFSAAAEASFGALGRAWKKVKEGDFSGAKQEFTNLGQTAGDAYRLAFAAASMKKAESTATTAEAGDDQPKRAQGGDGQTDVARQKAAQDAQKAREKARKEAKAARDKADQERLADLRAWVKQEGDLLDGRNALALQREQVALTLQGKKRQEQEDAVLEATKKQLDKLTGMESDYTQRVLAITTERDEQLRTLQEQFAAQDEQQRQARLEQKIKDNEADLQVELASMQLQYVDKLMTKEAYEEFMFQAKQASMDRELALIKQKNGEESAEYKKLLATKLKDQAAHAAKAKDADDDMSKFKKGLGKVEKVLNDDNVKWLEESLGKQTILYKAFKMVRQADALTNIGIALYDEIQEYWKTAAGMGPVAGPIYGVAMSGLAVARHGSAAAKIVGFEKGGPTGEGMMRPGGGAGLLNVMGQATGLRIGSNGKLVDEQNLEVAGIVHKNEYVIPEWMRQDPQVLQVESWLEARRQRGSFAEGGPTTASDRRAPAAGAVDVEQEPEATHRQLVQVLASLDQRLQKVEDWPTQLEVVLDLLGLDRAQDKIKKVQAKQAIRPK